MNFSKYHALGNDYIVLNPEDFPGELTPQQIRTICHRHYGVGSDGILWGPLPSSRSQFRLRIFNPDGSEAEKSGNGLRIFARFLRDQGIVLSPEFTIETAGGDVRAHLRDSGRITVDMGKVSFESSRIPVAGADREVIEETLEALDREFTFCAATVGNPHCVIPVAEVAAELARHYGPAIEVHPLFPKRTNVQFLQVLDRTRIRIEIWERGAGYTLASGSSSSAAAAVAHRLGLCDSRIAVHMPGGCIDIEIGADYAIAMTGSVTAVATGTMAEEMLRQNV